MEFVLAIVYTAGQPKMAGSARQHCLGFGEADIGLLLDMFSLGNRRFRKSRYRSARLPAATDDGRGWLDPLQ